MAVVARVLPRDWDTGRLLRFLAGLAMLALAFATPAVPATPASPPAAVTAASAETSVTVSEPVPAPQVVRGEPAPIPATPAGAAVVAGTVLLLVGALAARARRPRAPPAAA